MARMKPLVLVVAVADNGVIGKDGGIPWRIPEDLKHFKRVTLGHAVIMGRKTWESLKKPLVERRNMVITRNADYRAEGAEVFTSIDAAIAAARTTDDEPRIIGGGDLYRMTLPLATRLYLTEVHRTVDGDAFFPSFTDPEWRGQWRETERRSGEDPTVEYVTLERI